MIRAVFRGLNLLTILALLLSTAGSALAQAGGEDEFVARLIAQMSPEAKVGQLFVVSFNGTDVTANSDVADLILNYRVGGVVLAIQHGNILNGPDTPTQVASLTSALQNLTRQTARAGSNSPFIPLFVATEQDGDGAPNSQITSGLSLAPSYMAMGATWSTPDAEQVGQLVGRELSALGINLLLGPSLDVRAQPSTTPLDPGVNVFGGDPYWVSVMGQAYVSGLRTGSKDRLAVVLRNFPGQGQLDSDSYAIDRSLDDLKKVDLPPFLRLMQLPTGKTRSLADALMTTNVRYRGFSGNIRELTRPISLDSTALQVLIDLPEVKAWRDAGGLLMSDALGSQTVHDYYASTASQSVSAPQAALESFQAGNDVLILRGLKAFDSFIDEAAATRAVITFFRQKYSTDPSFQARVDSAVQRILRLKYRLYPGFDVTKVAVPVAGVQASVGNGTNVTQQVANDALTLLWPAPDKLPALKPKPDDVFLIATDDRVAADCKTCPDRPTLAVNGLAQAIERQYGVDPNNITSIRFTDLQAFVTSAPNAPELTDVFTRANWIVLGMQSIDPNVASSEAARQLLALKPNLVTGKRLIGFLFGPPVGLTAGEISRFTALYALYGKTPVLVDVAARALSGAVKPTGRSPVNLEALDYDLTVQTEPDPNQVIQLAIGDEAVEGQPTPVPLNLRVGDQVHLRTGVVVDRNGHAVPDGTPVRFTFQYGADTAPVVQNGVTLNGVAKTDFTLDKVGLLLVRASSEPALSSIAIQITINQASVTVATLLPPTPTLMPSPTPTWTPSSTPTITPTPAPGLIESILKDRPQHANWDDLLMALIGVLIVGSGGYWRARRDERNDLSYALRAALWTAIGGLIGYVLFSLGLPGSALVRASLGSWSALLIVIIGGMVPLIWMMRKA